MRTCEELLCRVRAGTYDETLKRLYALDGTETGLVQAKERIAALMETFSRRFPAAEGVTLFSAPGRTEIGGNHTDHQRGRVLCGSVDMDMLACAAPNGTNTVRICSEGFPELAVSLDVLSVQTAETGTSASLVRGVAAGLQKRGCTVGGFDACVTSAVLSGSGLSSSAAYEVLMGTIFNHFFSCGMDAVALAQVGQFAENVYFGKPSGLMDQMASSVGSAVAIDFGGEELAVKKVPLDLAAYGHSLCIIDTRSDHADLTDEYAAITGEMGAVAAFFGCTVLREVDEAEFYANIPALRKCCGDRAVLRAMHFFNDDRRAAAETEALEQGDFPRFLALVNESGMSSVADLQNIFSVAAPQQQAVTLTLSLARQLLCGTGAVRVHGGGFAGTVQAFVPDENLAAFKAGMEAVLGEGTCHVLHIRPCGGCVVAE